MVPKPPIFAKSTVWVDLFALTPTAYCIPTVYYCTVWVWPHCTTYCVSWPFCTNTYCILHTYCVLHTYCIPTAYCIPIVYCVPTVYCIPTAFCVPYCIPFCTKGNGPHHPYLPTAWVDLFALTPTAYCIPTTPLCGFDLIALKVMVHTHCVLHTILC